MKKILLALLTASVLLGAVAGEADAHRKRTKIRGPFGSWTWGPDIPHFHPPTTSESCLGGGSPPCGHPDPTYTPSRPSRPSRPSGGSSYSNRKYGYRIRNVDSSQSVSYYLGSSKYTLRPGQSRVHRTNHKIKKIEFDRVYRSGSWENKIVNLDVSRYDINVYYKGDYFRYSTPRD